MEIRATGGTSPLATIKRRAAQPKVGMVEGRPYVQRWHLSSDLKLAALQYLLNAIAIVTPLSLPLDAFLSSSRRGKVVSSKRAAIEHREQSFIYLFLDEGGNLDFSLTGTRYFT
jgi:hypothetical protein